jgi:hypothetical protein
VGDQQHGVHERRAEVGLQPLEEYLAEFGAMCAGEAAD